VIYFSVDGKPIPQGSMKFIRPGVMIHSRAAELALWRAMVAQEAKKHIKVPFQDSMVLEANFRLIRGKSVKRPFPTVPPDLDKLLRAVMDAGTGVIWLDDAQVTQISCSKTYADTPGVDIGVRPIGLFDDTP
jgi:crossover junction endodeoxyribonuclease RusA